MSNWTHKTITIFDFISIALNFNIVPFTINLVTSSIVPLSKSSLLQKRVDFSFRNKYLVPFTSKNCQFLVVSGTFVYSRTEIFVTVSSGNVMVNYFQNFFFLFSLEQFFDTFSISSSSPEFVFHPNRRFIVRIFRNFFRGLFHILANRDSRTEKKKQANRVATNRHFTRIITIIIRMILESVFATFKCSVQNILIVTEL